MLSWLLAIQSSFPIQWLIWPVASTLHHLRFLNRMPFNPKWTCIPNWKCLAMFLHSNRTELWIRVKIVHSSFFLVTFPYENIFCIKEMFGHRHPRRRILTCSRNSTKPFLVLITRAKVWNESNYTIPFVLCLSFQMISLLCTGRSDRVTRSIKSLVFKSRQSWKILVKLRVLLFKNFVIRQFIIVDDVFPFRQVTGSIRASLLRQVLLFSLFTLFPFFGHWFIHFSRWFSMEKKKENFLFLFLGFSNY